MNLLSKVIVAIDLKEPPEARRVVDAVAGRSEFVKIGMQAFYGYGDDIIKYSLDKGLKVFLDLKLCDIPNTVSSAIRSLAKYNFDLITVHISGGEKMLSDANAALKDCLPDAGIVGVTVLTSLSDSDLDMLGYRGDIRDTVLGMCEIAQRTKIYGIVCSAGDLDFIYPSLRGDLKIITPSIRMPGESPGDQKRVVTPRVAFEKGAHFIVMGRSIIRGDIGENLKRVEEDLIKGG